MINGVPHILLVDDNADFAREYSETLQNQCKSKVVYATTADEAIEIIKQNPIKVVILDQVMPTKGTDLFKQIKKIDSRIKTVLLTAEADKHDLTLATNIGFDYALLKEEDDMDTLPMKILLLIMKYNSLSATSSNEPFYVQKNGGLFDKKHTIKYTIINYEVIDEKYSNENHWITRNMVERGESFELSEQFDVEKEFNYTESFQLCDESSLGLENDNIVNFKNDLSIRMALDLKNTYTESLKKILNRKIKLEISDSSEDVISRVYEYAKVYSMIKVYIKKECSCCQSNTIDAVTVYQPIPIVKYRIKEYYDDGNYKVLEAGEIKR